MKLALSGIITGLGQGKNGSAECKMAAMEPTGRMVKSNSPIAYGCPGFSRPADVHIQIGDASKASGAADWSSTSSTIEKASQMITMDLALALRDVHVDCNRFSGIRD